MIDIRSYIKQFFLIGAVGLSFVTSGAQALVISASGTNTSIYNAQNLDPYFSKEYDHLIESSQTLEDDFTVTTTNDSTWIPHVSVEASVTLDGFGYAPGHFYSFTATEGARGIFDIDFAFGNFIDTDVVLFDSWHTPLANSDIGLVGPGETFDIDYPDSFNSFFDYEFDYTGTYFLGVGGYDSFCEPSDDLCFDFTNTFDYGDYTLHVSIEDHAVSTPEPSTLLLLGTALAGLGLMRRRKTISVK